MSESREFVTLREHLESQLQAMDRRLADYREAQREAERILNTEMQRRLDNLNHEAARLLSTTQDMKVNYVSKDVYASDQKGVRNTLDSLLHTRSNYEGRSSAYAFVVAVCVSLIVSIISAYVKVNY